MIKPPPFFSVIIPVYKVEEYLHGCVQSVLRQKFTDFEIILVDDCSPDACGAICDELAAKDGRIKVIHLEANRGLAGARNAGMANACGRYWTFLDSDDYWIGDILLRVYNIISADPCVDAVRGRFRRLDVQSGKYTGKSFMYDIAPKPGISFLRHMLQINHVEQTCWLYFIKSERFIKNPIFFYEGIIAEDVEWFPRLMCVLNKIVCINDAYYVYRDKRAGSIMNTKSNATRLADSYIKMYESIDKNWLQQEELKEYYLWTFTGFLHHIGNLERSVRRRYYALLPNYDFLFTGKSSRARVIRLFAKFFGQSGFGYPYYIVNRTRAVVRAWLSNTKRGSR